MYNGSSKNLDPNEKWWISYQLSFLLKLFPYTHPRMGQPGSLFFFLELFYWILFVQLTFSHPMIASHYNITFLKSLSSCCYPCNFALVIVCHRLLSHLLPVISDTAVPARHEAKLFSFSSIFLCPTNFPVITMFSSFKERPFYHSKLSK